MERIDSIVRTQNQRYRAHLRRGDGLFEGRESQREIRQALGDYFHEKDDHGQLNNAGYFVAPPRSGKTIVIGDYIVGINTTPKGEYVLRDASRAKRTLICVPTNQLVTQWGDRLLGTRRPDGTRKKSLFGDSFTEADVGIYQANMTPAQKIAVLAKPIVIMTDDSACAMAQAKEGEQPLIRGEDFSTVILDEVDERLRGDLHSEIFKSTFFGKSNVIGMTATELYRSGKTIGDYLFGGKKPICTITHQEAIDRREIAPNTTITFETTVDRVDSDIRVQANNWNFLTDAQKEKFIRQTGSDTAAIAILKRGTHPKTGERLRDLKQLWKGETVAHSKYFAEELNREFGDGYAAVVYGAMPEEEYETIMEKYHDGRIKALVQCKMLGRGYDDADIGFTGQLAPSQSPNSLIQFFTRADTRKGSKVAVHLTPYFDGIDQLHIGELLGGQIMLPPGWEFPATTGKTAGEGSEIEPWPEIEGVKVHYTTEQTEQFARKLRDMRYAKGLPKKTDEVLTLDEMATRLNIAPKILQRRVYEPLQHAYDQHAVRDKTVTVDPVDVIHISGWRFPIRHLGYVRDATGQVQFCIGEPQVKVCQRALYGTLGRMSQRPELLDRRITQSRLQVSDAVMDHLLSALQNAFFNTRSSYANYVEVDGHRFAYKDFGFFLNAQGTPELCMTADALPAAYGYCYPEASAAQINRWAASAQVKSLKTAEWLTPAEIVQELCLYGDDAKFVSSTLEKLSTDRIHGTKIKAMRPGDTLTIEIGRGAERYALQIAKKTLPLATGDKRNLLCLHAESLDWVKRQLNMEDGIDPAKRIGPKR